MLREPIQSRNVPERNKGKYHKGLEGPKTAWVFDSYLKRTDFVVFETILQIRGLIELPRHTKHITLRHARTNPPLCLFFFFSWMFNGQIGPWFGLVLHGSWRLHCASWRHPGSDKLKGTEHSEFSRHNDSSFFLCGLGIGKYFILSWITILTGMIQREHTTHDSQTGVYYTQVILTIWAQKINLSSCVSLNMWTSGHFMEVNRIWSSDLSVLDTYRY